MRKAKHGQNSFLRAGLFASATLSLAIGGKVSAEAPATRPDAPATQPAVRITPRAARLLAQVHDAYAGLKSLGISEKIDARFDVDGVKQVDTAAATGLYAASGQFRDELTDTTSAQMQPSEKASTLIGNTGEKIYIFLAADNRYSQQDAPREWLTLQTLGDDIASVLRNQDPSLALAISGDAAAAITEGASNISLGDATRIDSISYPTLHVSGDNFDALLLIDPQSHLLRRQIIDLTKDLKKRGAAVINAASITDDFLNAANPNLSHDAFAWSPPPGSQELQTAGTGNADLAGQPAPAFVLTALDGSGINSKSLKGTVYVLDFWATWCGPCCASLPHMDQMYKDLKPSGVKFFAVNQQESKEDLLKFVADTHLTIPVLLDTDGKVGGIYDKQNAIPFTVVVGKDGIIVKSGFFGGAEDQIRPLIEAANRK
jgi:peroxiredoxin